MIDGGQTLGPLLLISNLRNQSDELSKFQGQFWLKSLYVERDFNLKPKQQKV